MRPAISVVIISKDEPDLDETLMSLRPQCEANFAECIVVDASEGRLENIRRLHPWMRWIEFVPPLGTRFSIPHQRNVGVRAARADVIAFCDSGGMPEDCWLERITEPVLRGAYRASCGPIQPMGKSVYPRINDYPSGSVVTTIPTGNLCFRREDFERVGGFDERYEYGSDLDFGVRLRDAEVYVQSVRDAVMQISYGDRSRQLKREWRYGRARARHIRFLRHHRTEILRESPEMLAYPALGVTGVIAVLTAVATGLWWLPLPWCIALLAFYWRNRDSGSPAMAMLGHLVYGTSAVIELVRTPLPRWPIVTVVTEGDNVEDFVLALGHVGVPVRICSQSDLRIPGSIVWSRMAGVRVMHFVKDGAREHGWWSRTRARLVGIRTITSSVHELTQLELGESIEWISVNVSIGSLKVELWVPVHEVAALWSSGKLSSQMTESSSDDSSFSHEKMAVGVLARLDRSSLPLAIDQASKGRAVFVTGIDALPGIGEDVVVQCAPGSDGLFEELRDVERDGSVELGAMDKRARDWAKRHQLDSRALEWRLAYEHMLQGRQESEPAAAIEG
jgi:glycosyltransferase involved in cell wall biosynthesis